MKFQKYRTRRFALEGVRLPLIALVDVVLFLLLYFIIAGTLTPPEGELASSLRTDRGGTGRSSDLLPQILMVDYPAGRARFRIGERVMEDKASLVGLLAQLPKEGGIVLKVAGEAPVESAATALQACRDAGFVNISYVATR
jgi:biopolymer transport protein ExbD